MLVNQSRFSYPGFIRVFALLSLSFIIFGLLLMSPPACLSQDNASSHARKNSATSFSFKKYLFGPPHSLSASIISLNPTTGFVRVNGGDMRPLLHAFSWNWGDGTIISDGWFPQTHVYKDASKNYRVQVTSHYTNGSEDSIFLMVIFVTPVIKKISLPAKLAVKIPNSMPALTARVYPVPRGLSYFGDNYFKRQPRSDLEYILSVSAKIQYDFANQNVYMVNKAFDQVVLRDGRFNGMRSLWFTTPAAFVSGNYGFRSIPDYSSFFHEMGHNVTLNSPGGYYYGGKIDGAANAIFSESMAQIFAPATAYEILNHSKAYGFGSDLAGEIETTAIQSIKNLRIEYDKYLASGMPFHSWDNPATTSDETLGTFMTIAYKFCAHAEKGRSGYRLPLKRMMELLQHFQPTWQVKYDPCNNSSSGQAFRATLMVAALSHAFDTDLRSEFRKLNFPISNADYNLIMSAIAEKTAAPKCAGASKLFRSQLESNEVVVSRE
ncbi:MAG: hypothetical protein JW736_07605 [Deltaproteobacteria bacterium]|nr:hypothetical protein [Deltaproteobacteria bacterium]